MAPPAVCLYPETVLAPCAFLPFHNIVAPLETGFPVQVYIDQGVVSALRLSLPLCVIAASSVTHIVYTTVPLLIIQISK